MAELSNDLLTKINQLTTKGMSIINIAKSLNISTSDVKKGFDRITKTNMHI